MNFTEAEKQKFANQLAATKQISAEQAQKNREAITKVWAGASPVMGTLAEVYLRSRGIKGDLNLLGRNIMFHPRLLTWVDDKCKSYPDCWQLFAGKIMWGLRFTGHSLQKTATVKHLLKTQSYR